MKKLGIRKLHFPTIARIFIVVYIISIILLLLLRSVNLNYQLSLDFIFDLDQGLVNFIFLGFLLYILSLVIITGDTILRHRIWKILFVIISLIISIPVSIVFMFIFMSVPEYTLGSVVRGEYQYVLSFMAGDFGEYKFYECNKYGLSCSKIYGQVGSRWEDYATIAYDRNFDAIVAYQKRTIMTSILFVYKDRIRFTERSGFERYKYIPYTLYSDKKNNSTNYMIATCTDDSEAIGPCEILSFGYTSTGEKDVKLIYNEYLDALQVVADDEIIYSYNGQPHCLSSECKLTPF